MSLPTSLAWAEQYIGMPWRRGAQGPQAFDCWSFVRHVQRHHFGHDVPPIDVTSVTAADAATAVANWRRIPRASHGCGVFLGKRGANHVGIWLEANGGRVLHCMEGSGVILSDRASLRLLGFAPARFYEWTGPTQ